MEAVNARAPSTPRAALVVLGALLAFAGAWALLHVGFYTRDQVIDTPIYQRYGDAIARGEVPYRDFELEYPPAALPVFVLPSLARANEGDLDAYERGFETMMFVCGAAAMAFMLLALRGLRADARRIASALGFFAVFPLALGSVVLTRFDLWPAALAAAALAALVLGRVRLGSGILGLATAAKVYPGVLLPLALAFVWRRLGRREALACLGVFGAVVLAVYLPFLVVAPGETISATTRHLSRPLQIEALGAGILLVLHHLGGLGVTMVSSHGSQNLAGTGPDVLATLQSVAQAAVVFGIWIWFARRPRDGEELVRASAAAVCAFVALGKVFSPQFLIWLVPLVPLVRGRRGVAASAVLAACLVLSQLWFPFRYWELAQEFAAAPSWFVFLRNLGMLALLAILLWPGSDGVAFRLSGRRRASSL